MVDFSMLTASFNHLFFLTLITSPKAFMKHLTLFFFLLCSSITVQAQEADNGYIYLGEDDFENYPCQYAGLEIGGNAVYYSFFYERSIVTKSYFSLNIRPQLGFIPGSDADSIQRVVVPVVGLNMALGKKHFYFNTGISTCYFYSFGPATKNKMTYQDGFVTSISAGPRVVLIEHVLIGATYNYLINADRKHWFGISIGYSFGG